jgi:DNA-binding beta-propeller fold protein YncE
MSCVFGRSNRRRHEVFPPHRAWRWLKFLAVGLLATSSGALYAHQTTAYFAGVTVALGSGFSNPTGVAVDGNGNVYVADFGHGTVKEIVAAGGSTTVQTLASGFSFSTPYGVAVDSSGNVYVADKGSATPGSGAVYEIPAAGGSTTVNTLGGGFSNPTGVAMDGSGDVSSRTLATMR